MKNILNIAHFLTLFCLCSCSKHPPAVYEIVGMSISNSNNAGEEPFDVSTDSIPKQSYAIKITLIEEMRTNKGGDALEHGFVNEDQLTSLSISSLNNFDAAHPAGSSLNDYFLTQLSSSATISEFVSKGKIGEGKYQDLNYIDSWSTDQYLYLMTPPIAAGSQSFVVKIELSDGRSFCDTASVTLF